MRLYSKALIILLFNAISVLVVNAQTPRITALQQKIAATNNERLRLETLVQLLEEHESIHKDSLLPLAQRTIDFARRQHNKVALGYGYIGLINALLRLDEATKADSVCSKVLPDYPASEKQLALINFLLRQAKVNVLAAKSEYEGAVRELFSIIHDAEQIAYTPTLVRSFNELGVISYNRNELDKALEYYAKVLSYGDRYPGAAQAHAYAYINTAMVYAWREQFDSALHYINLAKPICERIQNLYYLANAYLTEANVYKWSKRIRLAEAAMLKMVALRERTEGRLSFSNEQLGLANFYVYAQEYEKAISIYKEGLEYAAGRKAKGLPPNWELELRYYEGLAKSYRSVNDRDKYEAALLSINAAKDSLYAHNSAQAIAEMQTKYEVQKKETTIIAQKLDITRKNVLLFGSLALFAAIAVIGWLLFRNYRRRSELKMLEARRHAEEAIRAAEEAERRRIASDLHDNLGSYAASIKSNADELKRNSGETLPLLELLQTNAQQMVSLLSDTIWAMRKSSMKLSDISDRIKLMLQRLRPSYPNIRMWVVENLDEDKELSPAHAYHLFMIVQEAINNALRHSNCGMLTVDIRGGNAWYVRVSDDGKGMNAQNESTDGGNGIGNMKARATSMNCSIEWKRSKENGTEVVIGTNPF